MFLWYMLSGVISCFLIFSHSYEGKEYSFLIGFTIVLLLCAFRYEKGYSLGKTMFTCIFLPLVGAAALGAYEYRNLFMKNLDQVVANYVAYQFVFVLVGVLATIVFLYKLLVSRLLEKRLKTINGTNYAITMSGSSDSYLSAQDIKNRERHAKIAAHVAVFVFIVASTFLVSLIPHLQIQSDELRFSLTGASQGICLVACWIFAVIYIFNCGVGMILSFAFFYLAAFTFGTLIKNGFTMDLIKQELICWAWLFAPSVAAFFLRELNFLPNFEDY